MGHRSAGYASCATPPTSSKGATSMARLLPYVDGLVLFLLRAALPTSVTVESELSEPLRRAPYVFIDVVGGDELHAAQLGVPVVEVDCYTRGSKRAAADLAEAVRAALYTAWFEQTVTPFGHLASFRTVSYPRALRLTGQPAEIHRYTGTYALGVRPPRA
ncbi:hypothetical protein JOD54_001441 [Actinokineospora baliensis]|uniref:hypothetical protein n=1 Tax=Actinokineospora baliensis TaxID=547056 RepID=UPI0019570A5F|nr:hypothetical protein [Actinokineospora baliensis]MBM7771237.1 hypothetical protein [Actinokineospora baliensis]